MIFEIKGIIKQKIVFNTRPTPIRNNVQNNQKLKQDDKNKLLGGFGRA